MEDNKVVVKETEEVKVEEKTFTQDDLNKMIQDRLAKAKKKAEDEKAEAERLANLSAEEKIQEQMKVFEAERAQFAQERLTHDTVKSLSTLGLNTEFASFLVGGDAESTKTNVESFSTLFNEAIKAEVDKRLKSTNNSPQTGPTNNATKIKKATEYNLHEMADMQANNPALFQQLFQK